VVGGAEEARHQVEWIDGRQGSAKESLPSLDQIPVPAVLLTLPYLHDDRPRGSKAMLDASGAQHRLANCRPGAWLVSPQAGAGQDGLMEKLAGFLPRRHYQMPFESARAMIFSSQTMGGEGWAALTGGRGLFKIRLAHKGVVMGAVRVFRLWRRMGLTDFGIGMSTEPARGRGRDTLCEPGKHVGRRG
jgi:hypothetical protein